MRGPYKKGVAMRAQILDAALVIVAQNGYSNATVKEIADAVGLSSNGILRYFGSKDALFVEVLQRNDAALLERVDPGNADFSVDLGSRIVDAIEDSVRAPGFSQLLLRLSVEGSEPDHVAHTIIRDRYAGFRQILVTALTKMQARGEVSEILDPAEIATIIASAVDGLQLQWLHDKTIDVRTSMAALLAALGVPVSSATRQETVDA